MKNFNPVSFAKIACLVIAFGCATSASADIIQNNTNELDGFALGSFGQSFTAEGGGIDTIRIGLSDVNSSLGEFAINVDLFDGIGGSLLASRTQVFPDGFDGWADFDFSGISLAANTINSFDVSSTSGRGGIDANLFSFPPEPGGGPNQDYTGGALYTNGLTTRDSTRDLRFEVTSAAATAVPEPGPLGFFAGGLALLALGYRRRGGRCDLLTH